MRKEKTFNVLIKFNIFTLILLVALFGVTVFSYWVEYSNTEKEHEFTPVLDHGIGNFHMGRVFEYDPNQPYQEGDYVFQIENGVRKCFYANRDIPTSDAQHNPNNYNPRKHSLVNQSEVRYYEMGSHYSSRNYYYTNDYVIYNGMPYRKGAGAHYSNLNPITYEPPTRYSREFRMRTDHGHQYWKRYYPYMPFDICKRVNSWYYLNGPYLLGVPGAITGVNNWIKINKVESRTYARLEIVCDMTPDTENELNPEIRFFQALKDTSQGDNIYTHSDEWVERYITW